MVPDTGTVVPAEGTNQRNRAVSYAMHAGLIRAHVAIELRRREAQILPAFMHNICSIVVRLSKYYRDVASNLILHKK